MKSGKKKKKKKRCRVEGRNTSPKLNHANLMGDTKHLIIIPKI